MQDKPPAVQAGIFLRNLFAPYTSGYMEIRAFNGTRREQSFHELPISGDRLKHLCTTLVQKSDEGFDVYVGVLPRKERFGKASSIREAATRVSVSSRTASEISQLEGCLETVVYTPTCLEMS